ncbi:MAG: Smr/MutS family protein [Gammaproteobacteria bacterium]
MPRIKKTLELTEEERQEFQEAMKNVLRFSPSHAPMRQTNPVPIPIRPRFDEEAFQAQQLFDLTPDMQLSEVSSEGSLSYACSGLSPKTWQRLRRGTLPLAATLDLHGATVEQAQQRLYQFLTRALASEWRCVCIVHGKSSRSTHQTPILKNKVNQWLRAHPDILAFCSAQPKDGGVGAVYVLLRAKRYLDAE